MMAHPGEQWSSLILTMLLSGFGLCGYIVYIYVVSKDRQQRFVNPFYTLILSWSIPEVYKLLQGFLVSTPLVLSEIYDDGYEDDHGDSAYLPKWYRTVTGFFYMASWLASVAHMLALAANRLSAVYWPAEYKRLYSNTRCAAILLACYFYAVFLSALMLFGKCRMEFVFYSWRVTSAGSTSGSNTAYGDTVQASSSTNHSRHAAPAWSTTISGSSSCSPMVERIYLGSWNLIVVLTIICDIGAVLGVLVFKRRFHERFHPTSIRRLANHQWSLTAQFTTTVVLWSGYVGVHWLAPVLISESSSNWASVLSNSILLASCAANPYVYILLGAMVRRQVFGLGGGGGKHHDHHHSGGSQHHEHLNGVKQNVAASVALVGSGQTTCASSTC